MRSTLWTDFKIYVLNSGNTLYKLLAINLAVFILFGLISMLDNITGAKIGLENIIKEGYLDFPASILAFLHKPWTIFTYQFIHAPFNNGGISHILYNMI